MSNQFQPYTGTGVCDVCNRSLSGTQSYIVPNDTFYKSRKYRAYLKNSPMASLMGMPLSDAYFDQLLAQDKSAGSAVCDSCIHMFETERAPVYTPPVPAASPPVQRPPAPGAPQPMQPPPVQGAPQRMQPPPAPGAPQRMQPPPAPGAPQPMQPPPTPGAPPHVQPPPAPGASQRMQPPPAPGAPPHVQPPQYYNYGAQQQPAQKKKKKGLMIGLIIAGALLLSVVAFVVVRSMAGRNPARDAAKRDTTASAGVQETRRDEDEKPAREAEASERTAAMDEPATDDDEDAPAMEKPYQVFTVTSVRVASLTPFKFGGIDIVDETGKSDFIAGDATWFENASCTGFDGQNFTFSVDGKECLIGSGLQFAAVKTSSGYTLLADETIVLTPELPVSDEKPEPEPGIFPISYTAYNSNYTFTDYSVGKDDDGTTAITLFGSGYQVIPIRDNKARVPAIAGFTSSGVEHRATAYRIENDKLTFFFSVSETPETITITNNDTGDEIVSFDVGNGTSSNASSLADVTDREFMIETEVYTMWVTYTGQWKDNKPNGVGFAIVWETLPGRFDIGDILEGTWTDGLLEGPGVYTSGDGVYQLKGNFIHGLKEGTVKQYKNGAFVRDIEFVKGSPVDN